LAKVEIGVLLPTREAVMSGRFETAPLLRMAEHVEALGYDSVWVGDSLLARPRFEPLTLLAAVAARTTRVALGTAVLLPALRHPLVLAQLVATVDRIAEGRLRLGVGIAPDSPAVRREFEAAGVPFTQRVGRLVESIDKRDASGLGRRLAPRAGRGACSRPHARCRHSGALHHPARRPEPGCCAPGPAGVRRQLL
jgi:alkanesulfonate monooxygenase SsuD/methylene tetrahydromethanopterin reductase-like flavin-dependent oxidoreductase (luciferase family)